jgi:hypothetical protein
MVFDQWFAVPDAERKHRLLLYLSDVERSIEDSDRNAPWVDDPDWGKDR